MRFNLTYKGKIEPRRFWHLHNRRQHKIEEHFAPKIKNAIVKQYQMFFDAIEKRGYEYAKKNLFLIVRFGPISQVIKELYHKSAYIESNYTLNYLKEKKKGFQLKRRGDPSSFGLGLEDLAPVIDEYFRLHLLNKAALPITETTRKEIMKYLINQVDNGMPLNKAIENFKQLAITGHGSRAVRRARMIALTESTKSMSFGGLIGAYMSGIDLDKVWVTSNDERVRGYPNYRAKYPHTELDLSESDMYDAFYNGERIQFPGDPKASIENIGNCRCAMFFKEKEDADDVDDDRRLDNFLIDVFAGLFTGLLIEETL